MKNLTDKTSRYLEQAGWHCRMYNGEQFWWRKIEDSNIYISVTPSISGEYDNDGDVSMHPRCKYYFADFAEHSAYILGIKNTKITEVCFATTMENYDVTLKHQDPLSLDTIEYFTDEIEKWVLIDSPISHMERAANNTEVGLMGGGCVFPATHIIGLAVTSNVKKLSKYKAVISDGGELFEDIKVKYIHRPDLGILDRALKVATGEWQPTGKIYDKMY